jgi:hypothetical protein
MTEPQPTETPTPADGGRGFKILSPGNDNRPPTKELIKARVQALRENVVFIHSGTRDVNASTYLIYSS